MVSPGIMSAGALRYVCRSTSPLSPRPLPGCCRPMDLIAFRNASFCFCRVSAFRPSSTARTRSFSAAELNKTDCCDDRVILRFSVSTFSRAISLTCSVAVSSSASTVPCNISFYAASVAIDWLPASSITNVMRSCHCLVSASIASLCIRSLSLAKDSRSKI